MLGRSAILQLLLATCATCLTFPQLQPADIGNAGAELTRRGWLSASAATVAGASSFLIDPSSAAAAVDFAEYKDTECKFSMKVPANWERSEQSLPDRRRIVLWFPPGGDKKTLMFVAYTPIRDDFTSLGSFGSVDQVAQMTILPKGKMMGQETESSMLGTESKKNAYFFDYKQKVPEQPETHFRTIFTLSNGATGGAGAVLVSITAQTPESEYDSMQPTFDEIVSSYNVLK